MHFSTRICTVIGLVLLTSTVVAQTDNSESAKPVPTDFAWGIPLKTNGDKPIYRLQLPDAVYLRATHPELGDLRVFNAVGEAVPHTLRKPTKPALATEQIHDVRWFPISHENALKPARAGIELHYERNEQGEILSLNRSEPKPDTSNPPWGYVLDLSQIDNAIIALDLKWDDSNENATKIHKFEIQASDDLRQWTTLVPDAAVAKLSYAGHQLSQTRVPLPIGKRRYLRMIPTAGQKLPTITAFKTISEITDKQTESKRRWIAMQDMPISNEARQLDQQDGEIRLGYPLNPAIPVDRVRLRLSKTNTLANVVLLYGSDAAMESWRSYRQLTLYNLRIDGIELTNPATEVPTRRASWIGIRWQESQLSEQDAPAIEIGWLAEELLFVAQGSGPFQIAFGNRNLESNNATAQPALLDILDGNENAKLTGSATAGNMVELGGSAALKAAPKPRDWYGLALWGALATGLCLLGWLARRLYLELAKQMESDAN